MMKVKLKELVDIRVGYSFRSRIEPGDGGNVAVIQMKDLNEDNRVDCSNLSRVNMDNVREANLVLKGDLIFRSRGNRVMPAIFPGCAKRVIVAAPLLRMRVAERERLLPEYLNWYMAQREAQACLAGMVGGTAQKMISLGAIREMAILLPPLEKQEKIVELAALMAREQVIMRNLAEKRKNYISTTLMRFARGE